MKEIVYEADAAKSLRRHPDIADRIQGAIEEYASDPAKHGNNVVKLVGSGAKRLRVGKFRVVFAETDTTITVTKVGPRGSVYD